MKILTAAQMREVDRLTSEKHGVPSLTLMENAGTAVVRFLADQFPDLASKRVTILCGKGNNGGDGLVVARVLLERGVRPTVVLLASPEALRGDARANYDALSRLGFSPQVVERAEEWTSLRPTLVASEILVDAILGTGLTGPVEGFYGDVIRDCNVLFAKATVVAVDIPSGLPSDAAEPLGDAIRADYTVTFTAPKLGLIFPPNSERAGRLVVAPIGSPESLVEENPDLYLNLVRPAQFAGLKFQRARNAHKGDFGHVLIVAGSRAKSGAAVLAARGALRAGTGLVTVATAASAQPVVASLFAEMMTEALPETEAGTISPRALDYGRFAAIAEGKTVIALGPGLSTSPETVQFVRTVVERSEIPLIVDADGLNALVGATDVLTRPAAAGAPWLVLTPHPGEMARLIGTSTREVQAARVKVAREFAQAVSAYVVLKGYRTLLATPDGRVYVNPTGNPGMGSGGTGDVLTGVLAGLAAQFPDVPLADVICLGVYLHGLAGDLAAEQVGELPLIASDIIEALPRALRRLQEQIHEPGTRGYDTI